MRTPPINVYVLVFVFLLYLDLFFVVAIPYITVTRRPAVLAGPGGDLSHGFVLYPRVSERRR